ncbi:MAG: STAS domain-containing protein, partial [Deltaproteobacteria bacterium]|nr:STAS domain-containing protein [Deltaproteobacteria bacterium]
MRKLPGIRWRVRAARDLGEAATPGGLLVLERLEQGHRLTLGERLVLADGAPLWRDVRRHLAPLERGDTVELDLSRVVVVDGGAMALLVHVRSELAARGVAAELTGASDRIQELVHLYAGDAVPARRRRRR